jgi:hypothetical protein
MSLTLDNNSASTHHFEMQWNAKKKKRDEATMDGSTQTYLRCWTIPCLDSVLNHHPRKANVQMQCTTPTIHDACMHQTKSSTPTLNPKRLEMYLVRCAEKDITMHTHPALRTLPLNVILFHSFSISSKLVYASTVSASASLRDRLRRATCSL